MLRRPTRRRAGTSLVEVLVGFGILGIGVTSVITLFPFSALTVGQALRDDRTTTSAIVADGELRAIHQQVVEAEQKKVGSSPEAYYPALDSPGSGLGQLQPTDSGPSYPVYIDPMGVWAGRTQVGDGATTQIPRVNLSALTSDSAALRFCSLLDSLTFDEDGRVPDTVELRELRYNFAWMVQRPVNRDRFTLRMQVVVYNKRAHLYKPPGSEADCGMVSFTPGETGITGVPGNADIRKGNWVMDAGNLSAGLRHAEFYRVLSVTDAAGGTQSLELHRPISRPDGATAGYQGRLIVMPGVADVFERTRLTAAKP